MLLKEVIGFNAELFFDGAVNVKWLYDDIDRFTKAANSFVFHNDDYINNENQTSTIGFLKETYKVINNNDVKQNNLIMGIAAYGAGKSHLITSIYTLFSNNSNIIKNDQVLRNIAEHDKNFAESYRANITKPNIILVLNGMEDFDLTVEMEKQIRFILEKSNISTDIFDSKEVIYEGMKGFLDLAYDNKMFEHFLEQSQNAPKNMSKEFLKNNLDKDVKIFNFVNEASVYIFKREFKIVDYLNPQTILRGVCENLCGDNKPFDKVIILFDEIGRYLEWMSLSDVNKSAIQQLFQGVQTFSNKVTFISFSQKSLDSYYNDIPKNKVDAITRYIDRFKTSKKYYISNILEMVFSRLVDVKNDDFKFIFHCSYENIVSWIPNLKDRHIWSSKILYEEHISRKLSVFHPLTIYSLVKLSEFTQKRSAINVLKSLISNFENTDLRNFDAIRPCDLFNTEIIVDIMGNQSFNNFALSSLQKYNTVTNRINTNFTLSAIDVKILQAITLIRILSLKTNSYEHYTNLITHISNSSKKLILDSLDKMQNSLGIIVYSEDNFNHYVDENSSSKEDLLKFIKSKKQNNYIGWVNDKSFISSLVGKHGGNQFENIQCSIKRSINTREWYFSQTFIHCDNFTKLYISAVKEDLLGNNDIKYTRSRVYWVYFNSKAKHNIDWYIDNIQKIYKELELNEIPFYTFLIFDEDFSLVDQGIELQVLENLSEGDLGKFSKFVPSVKNKLSDEFIDTLISLKTDGWFIDSNDYTKYTDYKRYLNNKLEALYSDLIPIRYESMDNKTLTGVKDYLSIAMHLSINSLDKNVITQTLQPRLKQRFEIILGKHGWNIFDENNQVKREFDEPLNKIINILNDQLCGDTTEYVAIEIFKFFYAPPYGINIYTFLFIIGIYFKVNSKVYLFNYNNKNYSFNEWFPLVCEENKLIEIVLDNSTIKINTNPKANESAETLLNEKDIEKFRSLISEKVINEIENIDFDKGSLIREKWQVIKDFGSELANLESYTNKVLNKDIDQEPAYIKNTLREVNELNNNFSKINKKIKLYFNCCSIQDEQLYKKNLLDIYQQIKYLINVWIEESREGSIVEIKLKLDNLNVIYDYLGQPEQLELSRSLIPKKKYLSDNIAKFAQYNEHIKAYDSVNLTRNHLELSIQKQKIQALSNQIIIDNTLSDSLKKELIEKTNEISNKINAKIVSDNLKIVDFIKNTQNMKLSNLNALLNVQTDTFKLLNIIDSSHKSFTELSSIGNEIDEVDKGIQNIREMKTTIDDVKHHFSLIKANINENLYIDQILKDEEGKLVNNILRINQEFVNNVLNLSQNRHLDSQGIKHILNMIEKKPISLQPDDQKIIERINFELTITSNKLIEQQIVSLFNKISDNQYKESLLNKLLNEI